MNQENQSLVCKKCGQPREKGRKLCRPCNLERQKLAFAKSYQTQGRYTWNLKCEACSKMFKAWRKEQKFCSICWKTKGELAARTLSVNNYIYGTGGGGKRYLHQHRQIAESIVKRELETNEVVHHMDNNPKNNEIKNLVVMDRRSHSKLHRYLDDQRVILEKSGNENLGNCWNNLIIPMTTTWLEITNVKVIKLWELSQSAAAPLLNEEGSETCAPSTLTSNVEGEDTVQTTTFKGSSD